MAGFEVITVTEAARSRLAEILSSNPQSKGIRIGVKNGGCAGMEYTVDLVDEVVPVKTRLQHRKVPSMSPRRRFCSCWGPSSILK